MNKLKTLALAAIAATSITLALSACTAQADIDLPAPEQPLSLNVAVGTYPGYAPEAGTRAPAVNSEAENFTENNVMWIAIINTTNSDEIYRMKATYDATAKNFVVDKANVEVASGWSGPWTATGKYPTLDVAKEYRVDCYISKSITGFGDDGSPVYDASVGLHDVLEGYYKIAANDAPGHKQISFDGSWNNSGTETPKLRHLYDRIRFDAGTAGMAINLTATSANSASFMLPDGTELVGNATGLTATADAAGNAYFYGWWNAAITGNNALTLTLRQGTAAGTKLFEAAITTPSSNNNTGTGASYHFKN